MQFLNKTAIAAVFKLCQPEEVVVIQVRGGRVLIENRLDIERQSDQRKQQVNGVKRVQKIAQESYIGRQKKAEYGERNTKENNKGHK